MSALLSSRVFALQISGFKLVFSVQFLPSLPILLALTSVRMYSLPFRKASDFAGSNADFEKQGREEERQKEGSSGKNLANICEEGGNTPTNEIPRSHSPIR